MKKSYAQIINFPTQSPSWKFSILSKIYYITEIKQRKFSTSKPPQNESQKFKPQTFYIIIYTRSKAHLQMAAGLEYNDIVDYFYTANIYIYYIIFDN